MTRVHGDDQYPFDAETLIGLERVVGRVHSDMLFDVNAKTAAPSAEQFFLLAIGAIEQAGRFLKLSRLEQERGGP